MTKRRPVREHHPSQPFGVACWALLLLLLALLPSCGGGGGGVVAPPPPPPPPPPAPPPLQITTTTLPNIVMGTPYSQTLQATGGTPPYTWSFVVGNPSPFNGITLSSSGVFGGTAVSPGCGSSGCGTSFGIQVRDAAGLNASRTFTLLGIDPFSITSSGALANTNVGNHVGYTLGTQGGISPFTWSVNPNSSLPPGMSLQLQGLTHVIGGMPVVPGSYSFDLTVADSGTPQQTANQTFSVTVENNLNIVGEILPTGLVQQAYAYSFRTFGGTPPYSYSLIPANALPGGLSVDPQAGHVIGIPTQAVGNYHFTAQVTDSASPPATDTAIFVLTVRSLLAFGSSSFLDGVQGLPYSQNIGVNGGLPPFTLRIVSGNLPAGLSFTSLANASGSFPVAGTPTNVEQANFVVEVTDSSVAQIPITQAFALRVNARLLSNVPAVLPDALVGTAYNQAFTATGGIPPYLWGASIALNGSGLTVDPATGQLSGIPSMPDLLNFSIGVQDTSVLPQGYFVNTTLRVLSPLLVDTSSFPQVRGGERILLTPAASGGVPPYSWSVVGGSLPMGVTMSNPATGELSGIPSTLGAFTFVLEVSDSGPFIMQTTQRALTIDVVTTLGRNDSIATATALSNGRYAASLSPSDSNGSFAPDTDYYRVIANPGALVTVETFAHRLGLSSLADTVIEIVDSSGARFATCSLGDFLPFSSQCVNDDKRFEPTLDSFLRFRVPGNPGTAPVTFYVKVLDWTGGARPEFQYEIQIIGAN